MRRCNNRGITLIALVVSIIVLLIIAGVSISMLAGQNGILERVSQAKKITAEESQIEDTKLALMEIETAYNTQDTETDRISYFENALKLYTTPAGAKIKYEKGLITYNGENNKNLVMKYNIDTGKIEKIGSDMNIQEYYSQHPEYHIPKGFRYLTGTVNKGYVITDAAPSETNGNEFVWIPVASEKDYVKKLGSKNGCMIEAVGNGGETPEKLGDISNAVKGDILGVGKILGTSVESGLSSTASEAKIVNAAGGFWVGRYETGVTQNTEINPANGISEIYVKSGLQPYRKVSQTKALELANNWKGSNNNNTASSVEYQAGLITGTQWDVMCDFISWDIADSDCTTWGNYKDALSEKYTGYRSGADYTWSQCTDYEKTSDTISVFQTGKFPNKLSGNLTVQKNIFDVAGNLWEWTTEVPTRNGNNRVRRGGSVYYSGSVYLASSRDGLYSVGSYAWDVGFRLVLYVK